MSRRLVISGIAAAAIAGSVIPSFASTGGPVTVDTHNGVGVGVQEGNTPIAGAHVSPDGQACVGISLEVPFCTPGGILGPIGTAGTAQKLPLPDVTFRHDDNGTAVGVGDVGVVIRQDGSICPVVSTQDWQCIPGN